MNVKNPMRVALTLSVFAVGLIAACQNQPKVLPLTPVPVQVASTEVQDPPSSTPTAPTVTKAEPAPPTPASEKTVTPNEPPTTQPPEKSATPSEPPAPVAAPEPAKEKPQQDLFADIAKVLQHPRCLNCHVTGDTPKQGDDRHDHMPSVKRGSDGHGSGLTCNVCHQSSNGPVAPGAPDWHLAPLSMAWEGLSVGDLCRAVTDSTKNGERDLKALATHLTTDPIVQWGWAPGGTRKPVPMSKEDFAKAVNAWVGSGGTCSR
jgi:hypothetical protein